MFLTVKKNTWAFLFSCLSMFILGLGDNIRGPLFVELMQYFHLTNTEASFSFAISSGAAFCGGIFSAYFLKNFSLSKALSFSILLMSLGLFFMGQVELFSLYLAAAFIFGFSMGLMGIAQNLLVAEAGAANQTKSLAGLHGLYGFSSLIAPMLAAQAPQWSGTWRGSFLITSILALTLFISALVIKPDTAFEVHKPEVEQKKKISFLHLLVMGGVMSFYVVSEILVSSRLALYMRTYKEMDLLQSSQYVTYFFIALLLGRLLFAFKHFPFSLKKQLNISLLSSVLFLLAGLLYHPFFFILVGLSMAPYYPLCVAYISEVTGANRRSFITFAMSFQSFCVISMHIGVGFLTDQFGLFYAFGVGVVSLLLSLLCLNIYGKWDS